jgi:hypothetical protein
MSSFSSFVTVVISVPVSPFLWGLYPFKKIPYFKSGISGVN